MKQNEAGMSAKRLCKDISQSSDHTSEKQKMLFRVAGWMCTGLQLENDIHILKVSRKYFPGTNFHSVYEKLICNNYSGPISKS